MPYESWRMSAVYLPYFIFVLAWAASLVKGGNAKPFMVAEVIIGALGLFFFGGSIFSEVKAWEPIISCVMHFLLIIALLIEPQGRRMNSLGHTHYLIAIAMYCWVISELRL